MERSLLSKPAQGGVERVSFLAQREIPAPVQSWEKRKSAQFHKARPDLTWEKKLKNHQPTLLRYLWLFIFRKKHS